MSRIDRFLLSEKWCLIWPNCSQLALTRGMSDHCPLVLAIDVENWGPRPLRMLKCWESLPGYNDFVRDKWLSFQIEGWGGYVLKEKLKLLKLALKDWHQHHSQNIPARISTLKGKIATLDLKGETEVLREEEVDALHDFTDELFSLSRIHSSICWKQSRINWIREGDANTKFFHGIMSNRRRRNSISFFLVNGAVVEGVPNVRNAVFNHCSSHFQTRHAYRPSLDDMNFRMLNCRDRAVLIKPFSLDEVKAAVWDCDNFKCPGLDGVNLGFIKSFWDIVKLDVLRFLSEFHRNGRLAKGINNTFIALIPKVDSPQRLNDFRPISLVGSMYKILAKVLANRLRYVIDSVVSDTQSAFIKGRQILDGILIANEIVDEAHRGKKELILFKVDFEKAYDSIDWGYLDEVMGKMGFPALWRKWIKECIGTATASVLVNGSPTDEFSLGRGLRQGDTLILGEKSWANIRTMRAILILFETLSGLKVNFTKNHLVGVNVATSWLTQAARVLNCKVRIVPFVYLGLPIGGNARRLSFWDPLITRIKTRLSGWKSKHLSLGGRLVLLKSVLSSLPVYALSFFKAPSGTVSSIESILNFFFFLGGGGVE